MSKLEIIELVLIIVAILGVSIYYLVKAIKNHWIQEILFTLETTMKLAEKKYPEGHGEEKKQLVLDAVKKRCEDFKIPYGLIEKLILKLINDYIKKYNVLSK